MYAAAAHIAVKMGQDRSWAVRSDNYMGLALCDGIGSFRGSGHAAELVIEAVRKKCPASASDLADAIRYGMEGIKRDGVTGGTTLLCCYQGIRHEAEQVTVQHLGNGAVLHVPGDFQAKGPSEFPYKYHHVVLPHVSESGALVRHVSHNSGPEEIRASEHNIRLNNPAGDILLLFTDGIGSLEEEMMKENGGNPWRYQQPAVQMILNALDEFLRNNCSQGDLSPALNGFVGRVLAILKERTQHEERILEDDAALGIVLTETVLKHYRSLAR